MSVCHCNLHLDKYGVYILYTQCAVPLCLCAIATYILISMVFTYCTRRVLYPYVCVPFAYCTRRVLYPYVCVPFAYCTRRVLYISLLQSRRSVDSHTEGGTTTSSSSVEDLTTMVSGLETGQPHNARV